MSVDVDICNSALIKLGAERINSLTDDNKRSRLCQEQLESAPLALAALARLPGNLAHDLLPPHDGSFGSRRGWRFLGLCQHPAHSWGLVL